MSSLHIFTVNWFLTHTFTCPPLPMPHYQLNLCVFLTAADSCIHLEEKTERTKKKNILRSLSLFTRPLARSTSFFLLVELADFVHTHSHTTYFPLLLLLLLLPPSLSHICSTYYLPARPTSMCQYHHPVTASSLCQLRWFPLSSSSSSVLPCLPTGFSPQQQLPSMGP